MTSLNVFWAGPRNVAAYGSQNRAVLISHTKTTVVTLFLYPAVVNRYRVAAGHTCNVHPSVREDNHSVIARGCKFRYITSLFPMIKMLVTLHLEMRLLAECSALYGKKNDFLASSNQKLCYVTTLFRAERITRIRISVTNILVGSLRMVRGRAAQIEAELLGFSFDRAPYWYVTDGYAHRYFDSEYQMTVIHSSTTVQSVCYVTLSYGRLRHIWVQCKNTVGSLACSWS